MPQLTIFGEIDLTPSEVALKYLESTREIVPLTVTSVSGGKSSAYMALHYPTDHYVFSCVLSSDSRLKLKDSDLKRRIQEKLPQFEGSHELPQTLANVLWLEEQLGQPIEWLAAPLTFEELVRKKQALPNSRMRFCTELLKVGPIYKWQKERFGSDSIAQTNLGIRSDEPNRVYSLIGGKRIPKAKGGGWDFSRLGGCEKVPGSARREDWRFLQFPMFQDKVTKHDVVKYFEDNPPPLISEFSNTDKTNFPRISNCRMCFFHRPDQQRSHAALFPESADLIHDLEAEIGHTFGRTSLRNILDGDPLELFGEDEQVGCLCR